jgi:hypothetical protein
MRIQTIAIYTFNELSDSAKETARNHYRQYGLDYEWWDCTIEEYKELGELLGIEIDNIYFSGFASQGDGACFTGTYSYRKGWKKALASETGGELYRKLESIGLGLQAEQEKYFYGITAGINRTGRYCHENSVTVSIDPGEHINGYWSDTSDMEDNIADCLRDFMQEIYSNLMSEYDYLQSDEAVDEYLQDGEWQFLESGDMY